MYVFMYIQISDDYIIKNGNLCYILYKSCNLTYEHINQPWIMKYKNYSISGINTLIHIMSRMGHKQEVRSNINHNERLEFLGDAVIEFVSRYVY